MKISVTTSIILLGLPLASLADDSVEPRRITTVEKGPGRP